jgi:ribosomal protein S18 acetylase RimI-like enzyme
MVRYQRKPTLTDLVLNELFAASWSGHEERGFQPVLERGLGYVGAFESDRLIGFVNLAWDGGVHAFLLDATVHPEFRELGIGTELVKQAVEIARGAGVTWLHVDFERPLAEFYLGSCGFEPTAAGLIRFE